MKTFYCTTLFLLLFSCHQEPRLNLTVTPDSIDIRLGDNPILSYVTAPTLPDSLPAHYTRSGFLHPVYSPKGQLVTDDFPAGHTHQHAIFTAWTNTTFRGEFHDFWNQHKETATVEHVELLETIDSGSVVGFKTLLHHRSLKYGTVLEETWRVRVHNDKDVYRFDLRSDQTNVTQDTLYLNKHLYGGLGVRGSAEWNDHDSLDFYAPASFLTSEGLGRATGNHSRPAWVSIYGDLSTKDASDGTAGLTIIPHPENFRAPEFVRLHPDMPYLSVTPVAEEGFVILPGATFTSRYTFLVHDGPPSGP